MVSTDKGETENAVLGIVFHGAVALFGGFALGLVLGIGAGAVGAAVIWGEASRSVQHSVEFLPFVVSNVLLAAFATPRWFSRSAPWVGILGFASLFLGWQELWRTWSPTWSHQTRSDYVLSQLFGVRGSCGESECLYMLLFTLPFVCLTAYSIAAFITLRFIRR